MRCTSPLALASLGLVALGLGACESIDYTEAFETEGAIERVVVTGDIGDLRVSPGRGPTAAVQRSVSGWEGGIALSSSVEDGTLYLSARCTDWLGCRVDTELELPAGAALDVVLGRGDVVLEGLDGPIRLSVSDGDVSGEGLRASEVEATLSSGALSLYFDRAPERVRAALAGGDTVLDLPVAAAEIEADLSGGELSLQGLVSRPGAPSRVAVISAGGDLRVSAMRADRAAAR